MSDRPHNLPPRRARFGFRSIGGALQAWHAGLLASVLIGFGLLAYGGMRRMTYAELDGRLDRAAQALASSVHPNNRGPRGPNNPDDRFHGPPPDQRGFNDPRFNEPPPAEQGAPPPADTPPDRGPDWQGPNGFNHDHPHNDWPDRNGNGGGGGNGDGGPGGGLNGGPPVHLDLPPDFLSRFGGPDEGLYYVLYHPDGTVFAKSMDADPDPATVPPDPGPRYANPATMPQGGNPLEPPTIRQRGLFREAYTYAPFGIRVLVGKSVGPEEASLRNLALLLGATGAGVLLIGLAGGYMLSRRVVRPLRTMAAVAGDISATNLSRRMNLGEVPRELEDLARVMNDMFARLEGAFIQQVRFTADASHELRTPLSVIHTHAQLALSRERDPADYKKTLTTCLRASTRMKALVDSLLILAGADAGRLRIEQQPFNLATVAEECAGMITIMAGESQLAVHTDIHPAEILGDSTRIAQVAINLLTNAVRYNRPGGSVTISTGVEGQEAFLRVQDTGIGIPPEHLPHIFDRFYRADPSRTGEPAPAAAPANVGAGGHGLGLAICKSIVDAHHGRILVVSTPDVGTTIDVRFPLLAAAAAPAPASADTSL